jgi:GTP-binding protein YchF
LGNQFLAHIREVSAIAHVVRCFEEPNVVHLSGRVDPVSDIEIVNTELALADIGTLEKRLDKLRRSAKANKEDALLVEVSTALIAELSRGTPARLSRLSIPPDFNLLTAKPVIYVCNVNESEAVTGDCHVAAVRALAQREGAETVVIAAKIEAELAELGVEEAREFLRDLGLSEPGLVRLIHVGYQVLGLVTFLTANDKEARAWTVRRGTKAPQAAGVIHSDFERGFIRAEVIAIDKLVEAGGMLQARARGRVRTEGKDYVVQDGDVIHFLF